MNPILVGLALTVGAPALKDRPKDETPILGDWKLVEWLQSGTRMTFPDGSGVEFLPGGKRLWRDGPGQTDERSYRLTPKTSPAEVDLIRTDNPSGPLVYPCIFKVEKDTLVIAVGTPGGERPRAFEASAPMLMTFTRIKKKD